MKWYSLHISDLQAKFFVFISWECQGQSFPMWYHLHVCLTCFGCPIVIHHRFPPSSAFTSWLSKISQWRAWATTFCLFFLLEPLGPTSPASSIMILFSVDMVTVAFKKTSSKLLFSPELTKFMWKRQKIPPLAIKGLLSPHLVRATSSQKRQLQHVRQGMIGEWIEKKNGGRPLL